MLRAELALALLLSASLAAASEGAISTALLRAHPTDSWATNGGNLFNQRYSPLAQITPDNVAGLKGVWHVHLNGSGVGSPYSGEAQPLVHAGVMYVITGADDVFAIDIDSGAIRWVYESGLDPAISTVCCGWTSRGVAIADGRVFVGRLDGRLAALDMATGRELWAVQAAEWREGYTITGAPLYYNGKVITGFAGAEYGVRGLLRAFDAASGSPLWTFHTVPGPGEFGHDTWPDDSDAWRHGGATVWHTPAVDPELGLLYFATGNPGPDFDGSGRAGDNLFSVSVLAIEAETGRYRWHFQEVHHDIWDYDAANPVVLFDITLDGRPRRALAQAGKTGWVYILDRVSGEPLLGIDERPVPQEPRQLTAATQPYPRGDAFASQSLEMALYGYRLVNAGRIFTPYWQEPLPIAPSSFGAAVWAPSSYAPESHTLFVCGMDLIGLFTGGTGDAYTRGEQYLAGRFIYDQARSGIFAAVDLRTNRLRWRQRWPDSCYSGSTATGGGLVFTGHNDGRFVALAAGDGRVLWEFQTGAGVNAPPVVFEHRGRQHVAVYAAGALFAQSPPGDSVWLFAQHGTLDEAPSPLAPSAAELLFQDTGDADAGVLSGTGAATFQRHCRQCHGAKGEGGHGGGPALTALSDRAQILAAITGGAEGMPGFAATLSYAEVEALVRYVADELAAQAR